MRRVRSLGGSANGYPVADGTYGDLVVEAEPKITDMSHHGPAGGRIAQQVQRSTEVCFRDVRVTPLK